MREEESGRGRTDRAGARKKDRKRERERDSERASEEGKEGRRNRECPNMSTENSRI